MRQTTHRLDFQSPVRSRRLARLSFRFGVLLLVVGMIGPIILAGGFADAPPAGEPTPSDPTESDLAAVDSGNLVSPGVVDLSRAVRLIGTPGFWRIAQMDDGVWWFVSPDNRLDFLNTVQTVQPRQLGRHADGPHFQSRDHDGGDDLRPWAQATIERVRAKGFKGLGAWCNPIFHEFEIPITRDLNVWSWATKACQRLYHPDWQSIARNAIEMQVTPLRDNRNLVGFYIDNELDWVEQFSASFYFNDLDPADPNRREVMKVIRTVWPDIDSFNRDWQTEFGSFDQIDSWQTLPTHAPAAYSRLFSAFLEHVARDYFRSTVSYIRQFAPNHLVLGVRFKGFAPVEVVRASRGLTDAQSLNYYVSDALLDQAHFEMIHRESDQPLLITEYGFHSLDGRSGNRNTFGFPAQVLDQQARADAYRLFTKRLARVPFVIGADWFQWNDEPPSGRLIDGEDVNFGIVDIDDQPYELLVEAVRQTAPLLNELHARSALDRGEDRWRQSFATRPTFDLPYLDRPIRLNGELSDWPSSTELPGIRVGQTVGLDRHALPMPRFHLAWNEQGLWVGFEVFDQDIQGAPADGWWWTRDCVEIWISTRKVDDAQTFYDPHCHQFFFVPQEFPRDGQAGRVGQWKRPGDALTAHRIPHPQIRHAARILPDRYVVEMHIPASALHGFDPTGRTEMSMNLHVRNFQNAVDYFWSAPKEVQTQLRPNTWGTLRPLPPRGMLADLAAP